MLRNVLQFGPAQQYGHGASRRDLDTGWEQRCGVADAEMHAVFNCRIDMTVIVSATTRDADAAMAQLQTAGETVYRIGEIRARRGAGAGRGAVSR